MRQNKLLKFQLRHLETRVIYLKMAPLLPCITTENQSTNIKKLMEVYGTLFSENI
jgi:hypothetical protein